MYRISSSNCDLKKTKNDPKRPKKHVHAATWALKPNMKTQMWPKVTSYKGNLLT